MTIETNELQYITPTDCVHGGHLARVRLSHDGRTHGGGGRCVPSLWSREAALVALQSALLMSRTWLTDYISRIEARAGRNLIGQVLPVLPPTLVFLCVEAETPL